MYIYVHIYVPIPLPPARHPGPGARDDGPRGRAEPIWTHVAHPVRGATPIKGCFNTEKPVGAFCPPR